MSCEVPGNTPGHSSDGGSRFRSPWASADRSICRLLFEWPFERRRPIEGDVKPIEVIKPSFVHSLAAGGDQVTHDAIREPLVASKMQATWLGHASVLVQFKPASEKIQANHINVLFDPMFSHRASPFTSLGPKRRLAAPCEIKELPTIHAVCISHNHYDHLDVHTIAELVKHDITNSTVYYVPLGCGKVLMKAGVPFHQIKEKDWWQADTTVFGQDRSLRVICTPAQHNSSRKLIDFNKTLWSSWVVQHIEQIESMPSSGGIGQNKDTTLMPADHHQAVSSVFFGGDTGYRSFSGGPVCPAFAEIGNRFGPFDLAFIPIWRGGVLAGLSKLGIRLKPGAWVRQAHCTPQDAVNIHRDIQARTSVAIHHSTFVGEDESLWSVQLLQQACDGSNGCNGEFRGPCGHHLQTRGTEHGDRSPKVDGGFVVLDVGASICA